MNQEEPSIIAAIRGRKEDELLAFLKNVKKEQQNDKNIKIIIHQVKNKEVDTEYKLDDDILFFRGKYDENWIIVILQESAKSIAGIVHETLGHAGTYKRVQFTRENLQWKGIKQDVKNAVTSCDTCQRTKPLNFKMEGEFETIIPDRPNQLVSLDFYGPLPQSIGG